MQGTYNVKLKWDKYCECGITGTKALWSVCSTFPVFSFEANTGQCYDTLFYTSDSCRDA
jgi:hypothetical protein